MTKKLVRPKKFVGNTGYKRTAYKGKIVAGGGGGFLDPPDYPTHDFHVEAPLTRKSDDRDFLSLESAAKDMTLDSKTRKEAKTLLNNWKNNRPPIDSPEVQDWIHRVLGYFNYCYQSPTGSWKASELEINSKIDPIENQDRHAGVHFIRGYYPEYIANEIDFRNAYWGTKPENRR